jgi:cell division protein FtsQ
VLTQVYEIAQKVGKDEFWNAFIEQIYVNHHNEIELVPRVGSQIILLGNSDIIDEKLSNLLRFYKDGPGRTGWDAYSIINLKYKNQVVCTRSATKAVITTNP